MARPNGSIAKAAAPSPLRRPAAEPQPHDAYEQDPQLPNWPGVPHPPQAAAGPHHGQPAYPPQGYPQEPALGGYPPADPAYGGYDAPAAAPASYDDPRNPFAERPLPPQGYGYPAETAPPPGGYDYRAEAPHTMRGQPAVAPQFEPFAPSEPPATTGYERFAPPAQEAAPAGWPPPPAQPDPYAQYQPAAPLGGYDRAGAAPGYGAPEGGYPAQEAPPAAPPWPQAQDWRGQSTAPGGHATAAPESLHARYGADTYAVPPAAPGQHQDPYGQQHGDYYAQRSADPYAQAGGPYAPQGGYAQGAEGGYGQGADGDYFYDDEAEAEAPRSGPRPILIVGALLGAIAIGGGMAYGYRVFTHHGPRMAASTPPVMHPPKGPTKEQPADPGGRTIAHTDKKFLNRLTDTGSTTGAPTAVSVLPPASASAPREPEPEAGPRKVTTVIVNRDGSVAEPPSAPTGGVPGMVIEGLQPQVAPPPAPMAELRGSEPAAAPPPPAVREPDPPPARPIRQVAVVPRAAPPAAPPVERQPRRPERRVAPPTKAGAGYVAVLASRKSRMEALKAFADMQQRYSGVLQGRTPDVREVNLGAKGLWYRVLLGPPGSRGSANDVCGKLKAQGFGGCWIAPY